MLEFEPLVYVPRVKSVIRYYSLLPPCIGSLLKRERGRTKYGAENRVNVADLVGGLSPRSALHKIYTEFFQHFEPDLIRIRSIILTSSIFVRRTEMYSSKHFCGRRTSAGCRLALKMIEYTPLAIGQGVGRPFVVFYQNDKQPTYRS